MTPEDEASDAEERTFVNSLPVGEHRPHYELNDGTCVSCGERWECVGFYMELLDGLG